MKHARLQPSSAERWTRCPGSAASAAAVPVQPASTYADDGTACHKLLAFALRAGKVPGAWPTAVQVGRRAVEVTADMRRWVADAATWVLEERKRLAEQQSPVALRVEARSPVGCHFGRPDDLWGHADAVLVGREELVVVDAKFGFQEVEVKENPQLTCYALGFAEEQGWEHQRYRLVVLQPRSPCPVKVELLTPAQLLLRGQKLAPLVKAALSPDAPLVVGPWCDETRCPAAGVCRPYQERAAELVRAAFATASPGHLRPEELAKVLEGAKAVRKALDAAEAHALALLSAGELVPGWKRVAGQGKRAWTSEAEAVKLLKVLGVEPYREVLLSPNQAEQELGAGRSDLLTPVAPKVPGKPTLAPETDPRPALPPDSAAYDKVN